jgi:hypothetical protein
MLILTLKEIKGAKKKDEFWEHDSLTL